MKSFYAPLILVLCLVAGFAESSQAAAEGSFDRTLPVSSPLKVDVWTDSGDISVRAGEPGKIEIHARLRGINSDDESIESRIQAIESNPPVVRDDEGHSVRVGYFGNEDAARNISVTYELVVPADTELHSETAEGDQTVEGIQGPVDATSGSGVLHLWHIEKSTRADTGSGDIDLRDVHGRVYAKAGTGTIHIADVSRDLASPRSGFMTFPGRERVAMQFIGFPEEVEIITGSGDVDVEDLEGGLQVTTGSGNMRVSGRPISDWMLDTGTGTVRVLFAREANFALVAHTSSGTIAPHDAVAVHGTNTPHELREQVGQGGPSVSIKTASGDIVIE